MKISSITIPSVQIPKKVQWLNHDLKDDRKVFQNFNIENNIFGTLNIGIRDYADGYNRWIIEIKNNLNKLFGKEILSMDTDTKSMFGYDIIVEPEYRRKGHRFGELMRLFSIMEMNENKSPELKIFSKGSAIYFHSKYKFLPSSICFHDRDRMLQTISEDFSPEFLDLRQKAQELRNIAKSTQNNAEKQRSLCPETNNLAAEYIDRAITKGESDVKHSFYYGTDMILTRERLLENKEFFNKLYQKHRIDYQI